MDFLPTEIVIAILHHVSLADLLSCELVCRRWLASIRQSVELWEHQRANVVQSQGCRIKREFDQLLAEDYPTAARVRFSVLKISRSLELLDKNLGEGRRRCISIMADDNASAFDVDFCHGRVAVFASRSSVASVTIFDLKSMRVVDGMEIDHLTHAATSIIKLVDDWVIRAVPVIGDRRMWNWRRKRVVTDLDYKAEKATPVVSIANNKLVDLVNRRKEIAVWKLKGDDTSSTPQFVFEVSSWNGLWKDVTHGDYRLFGIESLRRIADPPADNRIRSDLLFGDVGVGVGGVRVDHAYDNTSRDIGDRCEPLSPSGLMLRGFCLVSGYEFLRVPLDLGCPATTKFHLRFPFIIRHDLVETGIGRLDGGDPAIRHIEKRPLTLVTGERPVDGKRWLIGNGRCILASTTIDDNDPRHRATDAPAAPSATSSLAAPLPLFRYPPSFVPFATDDYFIVGYSASMKRLMVLDYLDVEQEEEDRRESGTVTNSGRSRWDNLLGRVKKLKEGLVAPVNG